jgi:hypothetical protein
MKWTIIKAILMPALSAAAEILAAKDENTTGVDDLIANQIRALIASLNQYDGKPAT